MSARQTSPIRRAWQSLALRAADAGDRLRGGRDPLIPPRRLNFVGDSDFAATGAEFLGHFRELTGLRPSDRVLDIGCGIGRMARMLARELEPPGTYDGFDIVAAGIDWCREHYGRPGATAVPFRFAHVDLHHPVYNPGGTGLAESFRFPYADDSFDLVIATSVFTHLLDPAAEHYLTEAARVLAPKGKILSTWFLLDPAAPPGPGAGAAQWTFGTHAGCHARVGDPSEVEAAVAYELTWLRDAISRAALTLREPIHAGSWRGRPGLSFQDIVVADAPFGWSDLPRPI